jgi:hypothetical protein
MQSTPGSSWRRVLMSIADAGSRVSVIVGLVGVMPAPGPQVKSGEE